MADPVYYETNSTLLLARDFAFLKTNILLSGAIVTPQIHVNNNKRRESRHLSLSLFIGIIREFDERVEFCMQIITNHLTDYLANFNFTSPASERKRLIFTPD